MSQQEILNYLMKNTGFHTSLDIAIKINSPSSSVTNLLKKLAKRNRKDIDIDRSENAFRYRFIGGR